MFNDTVIGFDSEGREIVRVAVDEPLIERRDRFAMNTI
jgi:CHASE1-domain containing sensor protein